jgi:hypothetical protein
LRTCGSAISLAASDSSGTFARRIGLAMTSFSTVIAPITTSAPSSQTPRSSAMRLMSTRWAGWAKRSFIIGSRLWPPARILASLPRLASSPIASATDFGWW